MQQSVISDELAIKRMYNEALAAFQNANLQSVLDYWMDNGVYLWPAIPPAIGKKAIQSAYEEFFAHWKAREIFRRYTLEISGDLAWSRFGTELTLYPKAGGSVNKMTLEGIHVYRRHRSGWRFQVVIAINVVASSNS